eukprot:XP_001697449.1 predicted protein [Chlamydomonas reinhardtii]
MKWGPAWWKCQVKVPKMLCPGAEGVASNVTIYEDELTGERGLIATKNLSQGSDVFVIPLNAVIFDWPEPAKATGVGLGHSGGGVDGAAVPSSVRLAAKLLHTVAAATGRPGPGIAASGSRSWWSNSMTHSVARPRCQEPPWSNLSGRSRCTPTGVCVRACSVYWQQQKLELLPHRCQPPQQLARPGGQSRQGAVARDASWAALLAHYEKELQRRPAELQQLAGLQPIVVLPAGPTGATAGMHSAASNELTPQEQLALRYRAYKKILLLDYLMLAEGNLGAVEFGEE